MKKIKVLIESWAYNTSAIFCIKISVRTINWMLRTIQASKCVDDVCAQHRVNTFNNKFTISGVVCWPACYVANDNFVVWVDIWIRSKSWLKSMFSHKGRVVIARDMMICIKRGEVAEGNFFWFFRPPEGPPLLFKWWRWINIIVMRVCDLLASRSNPVAQEHERITHINVKVFIIFCSFPSA